jgi:hypothetical protein
VGFASIPATKTYRKGPSHVISQSVDALRAYIISENELSAEGKFVRQNGLSQSLYNFHSSGEELSPGTRSCNKSISEYALGV